MGLWSWLFGSLSRGLRQPREASGATAAQMMPSLMGLIRTLAPAIAQRSARMARRASMAAGCAIAAADAAAVVTDNIAKFPSPSLRSCMPRR
jgi:hypothetical protein